jgi:hypothetical protein
MLLLASGPGVSQQQLRLQCLLLLWTRALELLLVVVQGGLSRIGGRWMGMGTGSPLRHMQLTAAAGTAGVGLACLTGGSCMRMET